MIRAEKAITKARKQLPNTCLADSSESLDPSHFSEVELGLSMTVSACMRSMPGLFLFSKFRESVGLHVIAGG